MRVWVPSPELVYSAATRAGRIVLILFATAVLVKLADKGIRAIRQRWLLDMVRHAPHASEELEKRAATIAEILRKTAVVVLWLGALMMMLREAGFDVRPLLAGAGVAGLAVGFGAQSLVHDVITGLFMLLENQVRINDVVVVNGTEGAVEELNLRTTVLRGFDGTVHIFHNGAIQTLSNRTREYSYAVLSLKIGLKEDLDRVSQALRELAESMRRDPAFEAAILEPLEVAGIDQFADGAAVIKARLKTAPASQWTVAHELNHRILKRFAELGIELK